MENLLLNVPNWVADSFPILQAILVVIISLASIILIVCVLASPANTGRGSNALTGASESYYTKHKGRSNQGRIRNMIIAMAITIALCAILYFVLYAIYHPLDA